MNNNNNKKKIIIKKKSDSTNDKLKEKSENNHMEANENVNNEVNNTSEDFATMFEQQPMMDKQFGTGDIVPGEIIEIRDDVVFVDVGYKSDGIIDKTEFALEPKVGDKIEVYIVRMENQNGQIELSKQKADTIKMKKEVEESYSEGGTIKGTVEKEIKGGFIVNIGANMEAFVPFSQMDINKRIKGKDYINKTYDFKITKYERKRKQTNIVLSRRVLLKETLKEEKEKLFSKIKENETIEGTVKNILDYGLFVDLGPIDGFVHLRDLSWGHIKHPSNKFKTGDKVKAMILEINKESSKVTLGIKQLTEDPWNIFIKEYQTDDVVKGEVTKLSDYGAFVKIFEGVEGLLHISEMSWTKKLKHPKEVLKEGDVIETKILNIDEENKKLSLGLKQVLDNPWDNIKELLPIGKKITGKINTVIKNGAFVELVEGIEGFLPQSELDWLKKNVNMKKEFKVGNEIEVVVLNTNPKERKITLGRKQLTDNPYQLFIDNHKKGQPINGKVTKITDFGAFVKLEENIEGMIPKSHVSKKRIESIEDILKVGDEVKCVLLDADLKRNKISLSIKNYQRKEEREEIEKYTTSEKEASEGKVTLGDLIDLEKFKNDNNENN